MEHDKQKFIDRLKEFGVVGKGPIKLAHGGVSDIYIDIKKAYGDPDALNMAASLLYAQFPKETTCVAAGGYGGIPLASAIAAKYNLKLSLVREKKKDHGTEKLIDGHTPQSNDVVAVIDDVLTTGTSIKETAESVQRSGGNIAGLFAIVDRSTRDTVIEARSILKAEELLYSYEKAQ